MTGVLCSATVPQEDKLLLLHSEVFLIKDTTTTLPPCSAQGLNKTGWSWAFFYQIVQINHDFDENEWRQSSYDNENLNPDFLLLLASVVCSFINYLVMEPPNWQCQSFCWLLILLGDVCCTNKKATLKCQHYIQHDIFHSPWNDLS